MGFNLTAWSNGFNDPCLRPPGSLPPLITDFKLKLLDLVLLARDRVGQALV